MSVKPIKINEKEYLKAYKDIIRLCNKEGDLLPGLLEVIEVPEEYDFKPNELEKIKISEEASQLREQKWNELEAKLSEIEYTGDLKAVDEAYNNIYNEELMSFIGRHMEYQKLIK